MPQRNAQAEDAGEDGAGGDPCACDNTRPRKEMSFCLLNPVHLQSGGSARSSGIPAASWALPSAFLAVVIPQCRLPKTRSTRAHRCRDAADPRLLLRLAFGLAWGQHFLDRQLHAPYLGAKRSATQAEDVRSPILLTVGLFEGARYQ